LARRKTSFRPVPAVVAPGRIRQNKFSIDFNGKSEKVVWDNGFVGKIMRGSLTLVREHVRKMNGLEMAHISLFRVFRDMLPANDSSCPPCGSRCALKPRRRFISTRDDATSGHHVFFPAGGYR
jgi:hypothetical protein